MLLCICFTKKIKVESVFTMQCFIPQFEKSTQRGHMKLCGPWISNLHKFLLQARPQPISTKVWTHSCVTSSETWVTYKTINSYHSFLWHVGAVNPKSLLSAEDVFTWRFFFFYSLLFLGEETQHRLIDRSMQNIIVFISHHCSQCLSLDGLLEKYIQSVHIIKNKNKQIKRLQAI